MVPADDGVPDQPVAGFRDLLFLLFGPGVFAGVSDGHGAGETVGQFDLVELFLDGLPWSRIVDVAQDEEGLDDLPEGLQGLIQGMLPRVRVQPPKDVRGGVLLEFDGGHKAQKVVPVFMDNCLIDGPVWPNGPVGVGLLFWFEDVQGLFADALDAWGKGEPQQMGQAEDSLGVAVSVGGMDITFHDVIVHEPIDDIGAFAIRHADHQGMPADGTCMRCWIRKSTQRSKIRRGLRCIRALVAISVARASPAL